MGAVGLVQGREHQIGGELEIGRVSEIDGAGVVLPRIVLDETESSQGLPCGCVETQPALTGLPVGAGGGLAEHPGIAIREDALDVMLRLVAE
jgi:hypothetical protein